jgi:hypothetical protein
VITLDNTRLGYGQSSPHAEASVVQSDYKIRKGVVHFVGLKMSAVFDVW